MITKNSNGQLLSAEFETALEQPMVGFTMDLYVNGAKLDTVIRHASLKLGAGDSDNDYADLVLGEVYTSLFEADLYEGAPSIGDEIEIRIGVEVGSSYEYVTVAWVTVTKSQTWQNLTSISAVGRVASKFSVASELTTGDMSATELATALSTKSGVQVSLGDFVSTAQTIHVDSSMTLKQALQALALRLGGFAAETSDGGVLVAPYVPEAVYTIPESYMTKAPELSADLYEMSGLTVSAGENTYTYGDGKLKLTDTYATSDTAALTWGNLEVVTGYTPGTIYTSIIDPRVTPFDWVSATIEEQIYLVPARGITITYDGGYFGSYTAAGLTVTAEQTLQEGPVTTGIREAKDAATEAQAVAEAVNQHFWYDTNGAHVTEVTRQAFIAQPQGANLLENSQGILLREGETNLASFTPSNVAFYDGQGNEDINIMALLGANGMRVGYPDQPNFQINSEELTGFNADSVPFFRVNLNGGQVTAEREFDIGQTVSSFYLDFGFDIDYMLTVLDKEIPIPDGMDLITWGANHSFDINVLWNSATYIEVYTSSGFDQVTLGANKRFVNCKFSMESWVSGGTSSFSGILNLEFKKTTSSIAESVPFYLTIQQQANNTARVTIKCYQPGDMSDFAARVSINLGCVGTSPITTTAPSFTLGSRVNNAGLFSAVIGQNVEASGNYAFAVGKDTIAEADNSVALGLGTHARSIQQTVLGAYNILGSSGGTSIRGDYALIIGNGTSNTERCNALAVEWDGSVTLGGANTPGPLSINFNTTSATNQAWIRVYDLGVAYGNNMLIESGGNMLLGSGEYPANRYNLGDLGDNEHLYLGSDGPVYIETNGNVIANRKTWTFDSAGTLFTPGDISARYSTFDLSKADNGVTNTLYPTTFTIQDSANRTTTRMEGIVQSNGNVSAFWYVRNYNTSGTSVGQKGIRMLMDKTGDLTYTVSDPDKFRSALGFTLNTTAPAFTNAANFELTNMTARKYGQIVQMMFQVKTTNALTANTNYTVATITPTGYRPVIEAEVINRAAGALFRGYISTAGSIVLRPNAAVTAGSILYCWAIFIAGTF